MKIFHWPKFQFILIIGIIFSSLSTAYAWEKFKIDVLQENPPSSKDRADHLLPSEHIFPRDYYLVQFAEIKNYTHADWMLRITLNKNKSAANLELFENLPNLKYDKKHYIKMEDFKSSSTEISLELAEKIYEVWVNVLFETRYSKSDVGDMEGKVGQFSTYIRGTGWLVGETQTGHYSETPPGYLLKIAQLLKNFIEIDHRRTYLAETLDNQIRWIYEYLEKTR